MKIPDRAVGGIVVTAFVAPVIGIAAAIWTGEPAWLLLCFALCLFL